MAGFGSFSRRIIEQEMYGPFDTTKWLGGHQKFHQWPRRKTEQNRSQTNDRLIVFQVVRIV